MQRLYDNCCIYKKPMPGIGACAAINPETGGAIRTEMGGAIPPKKLA